MKIYFAFGCFPIFKELFILFNGGFALRTPFTVFYLFFTVFELLKTLWFNGNDTDARTDQPHQTYLF